MKRIDRLQADQAAGACNEQGIAAQYSVMRVGALWVVATVPMVLLAWVVTPVLIPRINQPPALIFWFTLILGTIWQLAIALWIVHREEGNLRWSTLKRRTWLNRPRDPRTGQPRVRPYLWLFPCLFVAFVALAVGVLISNPMVLMLLAQRLPNLWLRLLFLAPTYAHVTELASPEFAGQWWLVPIAVFSWALTAFFAEEFFFRGVLLPRMAGSFGKLDWIANATLYALYHLHKPWMIPFRLVDGIVITWPARRYRSNWIAVFLRGAEGLVLFALVLVGVTSSPVIPSSPLVFPHIQRHPAPSTWHQVALTSIPKRSSDSSSPFQVDLRSRDVSTLDLQDSRENLVFASFDNRTSWPSADLLPYGFDPNQILETGKNPGLGLRNLHAQGITGRSVGIAIIDQTLLVDHVEYAGRLRLYEEVGGSISAEAQMHGPAVASIAVGKTVGMAPEADLYYIGVGQDLGTIFMNYHNYAQAVRRVLQINRNLPDDQKIRVISMSLGWSQMPGYYDITAAVQEAKAAGIFVVSSSIEDTYGFKFHGLGRSPVADPDLADQDDHDQKHELLGASRRRGRRLRRRLLLSHVAVRFIP